MADLDARRLASRARTQTKGERFTRWLQTDIQFCEEARADALTR